MLDHEQVNLKGKFIIDASKQVKLFLTAKLFNTLKDKQDSPF